MLRSINLSCFIFLALSPSVEVYSADLVSIPAQDVASAAPTLTLEQAIAWRQNLLNRLQYDRQLIQGALTIANNYIKTHPISYGPYVTIRTQIPGSWEPDQYITGNIPFENKPNWKGVATVYGGIPGKPLARIDYKIYYSIPGRTTQQFSTSAQVSVVATYDGWQGGQYNSIQYIAYTEWSKLRDALNKKAVSLSNEIQSLRKQQQAALTIKAAG